MDYLSAVQRLLDRPIRENDLLQAASRVARPKSQPEPAGQALLVFRIGQEWLALPAECFEHVLPIRPIHTIPHCRGAVHGLVNVQGQLHLAVRAGAVLDLQRDGESTESARLLLARQEETSWAFEVDAIHGFLRLDDDRVQVAPVTLAKSPTSHTRGVFELDDKRVALLDAGKFFEAIGRAMR
jgi:chemotaxis-related protein WspD